MAAVALAALAGLAFGALAVAVRWGLRRYSDAFAGALVATVLAALVTAAAAAPSIAAGGVHPGELWPFVVAGLIAPGASQVVLTVAVSEAGASRAAILMGTAPLVSIAIALSVLGEPFQPLLVVATVLIVLGGITLARERTRPEGFRVRGVLLALLCAGFFAIRDNVLRAAAHATHPSPLIAAATSLAAASAVSLVYAAIRHRAGVRMYASRAIPAFVPAGLALAAGYGSLLEAFSRGRVSVVSPLNATGALWTMLLARLFLGSGERTGRRTLAAATLIVTGGGLIGALR
jgi:drug/metabolite transporter (DMT)-like permease